MFCELETKVVLFAREIVDGGGGGVAPELTVSEKLVVLTSAPAVPDTTTVYVPAGVEELVLMVRVDVQFAKQEPGTYDALEPVGNPEVAKEMLCEFPEITFAVTELETDEP